MTYTPNPKDPRTRPSVPQSKESEPASPKLAQPATERGPAPPKLAQQASEGGRCDRCGAEMFRMHAVWRCPRCGYKTDCCGW